MTLINFSGTLVIRHCNQTVHLTCQNNTFTMQSVYPHKTTLHIEPSYYDNGVPVFQPTMHEFRDFYNFNKAINKYGMQSGIVKVIPPTQWVLRVQKCYTESNLEQVSIQNPIVQSINTNAPGIYQLQNIERYKKYSIFQWKEMAKTRKPPRRKQRGKSETETHSKDIPFYNINTSEYTDDRCKELETNYWRSLSYSEPMYGADTMGSVFDKSITAWNVAHLPNLLDLMEEKLPGVNQAYLYAGLWKASFAWHLEDQDLYLINYLHFGAPKQWYLIPQSQHEEFYALMVDLFHDEFKQCSEFLRHKTFMVSPAYLEKHGIRVNHTIHREGEFIITYPYGYHAGFNYDYNLAESVNFALDDWFEFGKRTKKCECISDSVGINIKHLWEKYYGTKYEAVKEEDGRDGGLEADSDGSIEVVKVEKIQRKCRKRKQDNVHITNTHESVSTKRPHKQPDIPRECALCPNTLQQTKYSHSALFELLQADTYGTTPERPRRVHKICASMFPHQLKCDFKTNTVHGLDDITKNQKKLRCGVCRQSEMGACFQCSYKKCTRAFHGTCGLVDGVQYDFDSGEAFCKFHRQGPTSAEFKVGMYVQFLFNHGVYFGQLVNLGDGDVEVEVYPSAQDVIEIPTTSIINVV